MLIDAQVMTELLRLARIADNGIRLTAKTSRFQTESALRPLYEKLNDAYRHQVHIEWEPHIKKLISEIRVDKQLKYSLAIKYVEKNLLGQESKIFSTLRAFSEKLSKSQQRYTNPLIGDAGHGLCSEMALCWLDEQFGGVVVQFPRLASGNVVGSRVAYDLTRKAMTMSAAGNLQAKAAKVDLILTPHRQFVSTSFDTFYATCHNNRHITGGLIKGYLIVFFGGLHAVAIFRENGSYQFYDANAGSYRITAPDPTAFLRDYNNVCLPKKWRGYDELSTKPFDRLYAVSHL